MSSFNRYAHLLDSEFNVYQSKPIRFEYFFNNIQYTTVPKVLSSIEIDDGSTLCYATQGPDNDPWSVLFLKLNIQSDTIIVKEIIPLNDPPLNISLLTQMRVDSSGDYVISGNNGLTFGAAPNQIRVAKFSPVTHNRLWEFTFDNGYSYEIYDMDIDQNNDIIIVGRANLFADGIRRGFLLKLYANGTLSSYTEQPIDDLEADFLLFPNPATAEICLKTKGISAQNLRLWDMRGALIMERQIPSYQSVSCIPLPTIMPRGVYIAEIQLDNGQRLVRRVVVE